MDWLDDHGRPASFIGRDGKPRKITKDDVSEWIAVHERQLVALLAFAPQGTELAEIDQLDDRRIEKRAVRSLQAGV
jgi:hypothetical protein